MIFHEFASNNAETIQSQSLIRVFVVFIGRRFGWPPMNASQAECTVAVALVVDDIAIYIAIAICLWLLLTLPSRRRHL